MMCCFLGDNLGVPSTGGEISQEVEFDEGETYLLPLGACDGENEEAAEAGGYQLPLQCEVGRVSRRTLCVCVSSFYCIYPRISALSCYNSHSMLLALVPPTRDQ